MGSSPIRVATFLQPTYADLAHLVERRLAKAKVAGSSPVIRSKKNSRPIGLLFFFGVLRGEERRARGACDERAGFEPRNPRNLVVWRDSDKPVEPRQLGNRKPPFYPKQTPHPSALGQPPSPQGEGFLITGTCLYAVAYNITDIL